MNKQVSHGRAVLELNLATFMISWTGVLARVIEWAPPFTIFARTLLAAPFLLLFALLSRRAPSLVGAREYGHAAAQGTLLALHWVTYFESIRVAGVAVGVISLFTYPIFTVLLEPLWSRVRPRAGDLIIAAAVLGGVALLVPTPDIADDTTRGVLVGLVSAVCLALRNIMTRRYLHGRPSLTVMLYQTTTAALVLSPVLFFHHPVPDLKNTGYALVLAVVCTAGGHTLFVKSLGRLGAKSAGIIASMQPLYSIMLAIILLNEIPGTRTIIGGAIILGAVILEVFRAAPANSPSNSAPRDAIQQHAQAEQDAQGKDQRG